MATGVKLLTTVCSVVLMMELCVGAEASLSVTITADVDNLVCDNQTVTLSYNAANATQLHWIINHKEVSTNRTISVIATPVPSQYFCNANDGHGNTGESHITIVSNGSTPCLDRNFYSTVPVVDGQSINITVNFLHNTPCCNLPVICGQRSRIYGYIRHLSITNRTGPIYCKTSATYKLSFKSMEVLFLHGDKGPPPYVHKAITVITEMSSDLPLSSSDIKWVRLPSTAVVRCGNSSVFGCRKVHSLQYGLLKYRQWQREFLKLTIYDKVVNLDDAEVSRFVCDKCLKLVVCDVPKVNFTIDFKTLTKLRVFPATADLTKDLLRTTLTITSVTNEDKWGHVCYYNKSMVTLSPYVSQYVKSGQKLPPPSLSPPLKVPTFHHYCRKFVVRLSQNVTSCLGKEDLVNMIKVIYFLMLLLAILYNVYLCHSILHNRGCCLHNRKSTGGCRGNTVSTRYSCNSTECSSGEESVYSSDTESIDISSCKCKPPFKASTNSLPRPAAVVKGRRHKSTKRVNTKDKIKLDLFINYYSKLAKLLPIRSLSAYFVSQRLIDFQDQEEILRTPVESIAACVVLKKVAEHLEAGQTKSFDLLLSTMERYGSECSVELVNEIRSRLN